MPESRWAEISCVVPEEMADLLADFLLELTGNGVSIENRTVDTFNIDELPDTPLKTVKAYLPEDAPREELLSKITGFLTANEPYYAGFSSSPLVVSILKEEDWANSWKINFKIARIGDRLVIKPSWEDYAPLPEDIVLELDPGMAFGTGTHATTRLCLEALERLAFSENWLASRSSSVLDVGCGSGVLSIAAALFGAGHVTALDIDPLAVEVTIENAAINGVRQIVSASTASLAETGAGHTVVMANILAEDLVNMSSQLTEQLLPGGHLILSGILIEREDYVINGFSSPAMKLESVTRQDEWSCLLYKKEN